MSDELNERELQQIEYWAKGESAPEVYGDTSLRMVEEIRELRLANGRLVEERDALVRELAALPQRLEDK